MKVGNQYYWYHNDHIGTPQVMTTASGAVVWSAKYASFGKATVDSSSTVVNPLRFPGQYEDSETGLHYNRWRYYSTELGKYLNTDPLRISQLVILVHLSTNQLINNYPVGIDQKLENVLYFYLLSQYGSLNPQLQNVFSYSSNNPANLIDPTGEIGLVGAGSGFVGGAIGGAIVGAATGGWKGALSGAISGAVIGGAVGFFTGPVGGINAGTIGSGFITGFFGELSGPKELGYGLHPDGPGCNP